MRGFGITFEVETGRVRSWYSSADGVKRWADTTEIVPDEVRRQDDLDDIDNGGDEV